jgi:hypothetical protein
VPGVEEFSAHLKFGEPHIDAHRRIAADSTHAEIRAWRESGVLETVA